MIRSALATHIALSSFSLLRHVLPAQAPRDGIRMQLLGLRQVDATVVPKGA